MLKHALAHGKSLGLVNAVIHVVNVRQDIMSWYQRVGFVPNGETCPFPTLSDPCTSKPLIDLFLVTLKKPLSD